MATSLTGAVTINAAIDFVNSLDVGEASYPMKFGGTYAFTNGTGANQANQLFADTRTLSASASEDLDLAGGLTDPYGNSITFTKIKALIVQAAAGNINDVQVGGDGSAGITSLFGAAADFVNVKPGGLVAFIAPDATGYAVTATTADLLQFTNSAGGTDVTYTVIIVGTV